MLLAFLLAAVPALIGRAAQRCRSPTASYVLAALALPLSEPVSGQPLMSLPRFLVVLFPLAHLARRRGSPRIPARSVRCCSCSAVLMAFFVAQFATWHWVA